MRNVLDKNRSLWRIEHIKQRILRVYGFEFRGMGIIQD